MKTCPICNATCFDDMEICFECLHDFSAGIVDVLDGQSEDPYSPVVQKMQEAPAAGLQETLVVPALTVAQSDGQSEEGVIHPKKDERTIVITLQGFDRDAVVKIQ